MTALAIIGFIALFFLGCYLFVAGGFCVWMSLVFRQFAWQPVAIALLGLVLIGAAVWLCPLAVVVAV